MNQVKCTILSSILEEVPSTSNYPLQVTVQLLVELPDGSTVVIPKIIHEPLWYSRKYRLQIFSKKEKKIVPMKDYFDVVTNLDTDMRSRDTMTLTSLVLGLINYGEHVRIIQPKSGLSFMAFLSYYRGKPIVTRYHFDGTHETYPDPFTLWFDHEAVEQYVSSFI